MKGYKSVGLPHPPTLRSPKEKNRNERFLSRNNQSEANKQAILDKIRKLQDSNGNDRERLS